MNTEPQTPPRGMRALQHAGSELQQRIAIGYTRVSTADQAENGVSLAAQRERIEHWCITNGYTLAAMYAEDKSGGRADNRPRLKKALAAVKRTRGVLIVYSLSRFARSTLDCINLVQQIEHDGGQFISLTEAIDTSTATGRLFFTIVAAFGAFEREIIAERTRGAMQHKRGKGELLGGRVPYGWALAPGTPEPVLNERTGHRRRPAAAKLIEVPAEQQVLKLIRAMRTDYGYTLVQIRDELARRQVPTQAGKATWAVETLRGIIKRQGSLT